MVCRGLFQLKNVLYGWMDYIYRFIYIYSTLIIYFITDNLYVICITNIFVFQMQ